MLEIVTFTLGPAQTNAYLVADSDTKEAVVIDPAWDGHIILDEAQKRGWRIGHRSTKPSRSAAAGSDGSSTVWWKSRRNGCHCRCYGP